MGTRMIPIALSLLVWIGIALLVACVVVMAGRNGPGVRHGR